MNWEALGAIGEIVGAVAVVLTLGYLAVQIRQNTRTLRTSSHQASLDGFRELNRVLNELPELALIYRRGRNEPDSLPKDETLASLGGYSLL
jgi:hypothetical protein